MTPQKCPECHQGSLIDLCNGSYKCDNCEFKVFPEKTEYKPKPKQQPKTIKKSIIKNSPSISHPNLNWVPKLGQNGHKWLFGIGVVAMFSGFTMDTSVNGTHNIGLIKDSQNLTIIGGALTISGAVFSLKKQDN